MTAAEDIQRDLELSATETDAAAAAARENQKSLHTAMPGIIKSFDPQTQTAIVQPAIRRVWVDDGEVDLPPCVDVPVQFPGAAGGVITFPVQAGDECLLVFSERAIDNWYESGGTQAPSAFRLHDLSDAFAMLGVRSKPNVIKNVATDAVELRTVDGVTLFRLEASAAIAGQKTGAELAVKGETYRSAEDALFNALKAFFAAIASPCTTASNPAQTMAAVNTIGGAASTLIPFFATFAAQASAYLAQRAKVG